MGILPEPKDSNDNRIELPRDKLLEFLKVLMGEDGVTFLNLDTALAAVKQAQPFWQASFVIGLWALPLLYFRETDSQGKLIGVLYRFPRDIDSRDKGVLLGPVLMVFGLSSQIYLKSKDMAVSDLVDSALESLEACCDSLSAEVSGDGLTDEDAHILFHTRFALGILLLVKGDETRGTTILRQMAATKSTRRGPTILAGTNLDYLDVEVTKEFAAMILQDFYAKRQNYTSALYFLTEAVASSGSGSFSESLLAVVPLLLESFAEKCERVNSFYEWVDLFDRVAGITEVCGEADASGILPSECKVNSPQFLAWKFGQAVARFAIRNNLYLGDTKQLLPDDCPSDGTVVDSILWECGSGWGNGTLVASLLCEYNERRNWQILRQQYVSMWQSSSRYQWLSLCEAGTWTDLYWAVKIGFADKMLETTEQGAFIRDQSEPLPINRDIGMTKDIITTVALRQLKEQKDIDKILELLQKLIERQPLSIQEVLSFLEQQLCGVWHKLTPVVADKLLEAEQIYKSGTRLSFATISFAQAIETCFHCYFVNPFADYMKEEGLEEMALVMDLRDEAQPIRIGIRPSRELRVTGLNYLSLRHWAGLFETLVDSGQKGTTNSKMKIFMKQKWPKLVLDNLNGLLQPLRIVQRYRNNAVHTKLSRSNKEEKIELEQMRNVVLGTDGPSLITQIFQLFGTAK